jgi:hypothetical protein
LPEIALKTATLGKGPGVLAESNLPISVREGLLFCLSPDPGLALSLFAGDDPARLTELRLRGLTPFLYWQLRRQGWQGSIPPQSLGWLKHDYAQALQRVLRQEQESFQIIQSLVAAGVEVILLKGADFRQRLYDDAAARPAADLDLLVSPEHLPRAEAALVALGYPLALRYQEPRPGYQRQFGHALEYQAAQGRLALDLHWQIVAVSDFYRLPFHLLRPRAVSWDYQGLPVLLLAPEHLLLHLCLRLYNDEFSVLFLLDLALALLRLDLDWRLFLAETSRFNCQRPVYLILSNLPAFLPRKVPPWVLAELGSYRPSRYESLAFSPRLRFLTLNFPMLYHNYPLRAWPQYYLGKIWPTPEYLTALFGTPNRLAHLRQLLNVLFAKNKPK